jgi:hypothetical protein
MIYLKYSGSIESKEATARLIDEFVDISRISGWEYNIISENFQTMTAGQGLQENGKYDTSDDNDISEIRTLSSSEVYLEGIVIHIRPDADPVRLTFDRNGKLATISFSTTDTPGFNKKLTVKKYEFIYYPFIKLFTRDADYHSQAVKLLDYVKKKYIYDLEVMDPSYYWETRDVEQLKVKLWKAALKQSII